jgi:hypothetical protein
MSLVDSERAAIQNLINLNPHTLSVTRPTATTNARGVTYTDYNTTSTVDFDNPVRVVWTTKPGSLTVEATGKYFNSRAYYVIADYETEIQKYDRFTYKTKTYEIMDVEPVYINDSLRNYQAELNDLTTGQA